VATILGYFTKWELSETRVARWFYGKCKIF